MDNTTAAPPTHPEPCTHRAGYSVGRDGEPALICRTCRAPFTPRAGAIPCIESPTAETPHDPEGYRYIETDGYSVTRSDGTERYVYSAWTGRAILTFDGPTAQLLAEAAVRSFARVVGDLDATDLVWYAQARVARQSMGTCPERPGLPHEASDSLCPDCLEFDCGVDEHRDPLDVNLCVWCLEYDVVAELDR